MIRPEWYDLIDLEPQDGRPPSLSRGEVVAMALSVSLPIQVAWAILFSLRGILQLPNSALLSFAVPLLIPLVLILLGLMGKPLLQRQSWALGPTYLARRVGGLQSLDTVTFILILALAGLWVLLSPSALFSPMVPSAVHAVLALGALRRIRALPDDSDSDEADEGEEEVEMGEGSHHVFVVKLASGPHAINIWIPQGVRLALRQANIDAGGFLYQENHEAVTLLDRAPVEGTGHVEMSAIAKALTNLEKRTGMSRFNLANRALAAVQTNIAYEYDIDSTGDVPGGPYKEYGRFALETIHDGVGDCDCTALLCSSLLAFAGFRSCLFFVRFQKHGTESYHLAVGIDVEDCLGSPAAFNDALMTISHDGRSYLYGETAIDWGELGWGSLPGRRTRTGPLSWDNMEGEEMVIERILPVPAVNL